MYVVSHDMISKMMMMYRTQEGKFVELCVHCSCYSFYATNVFSLTSRAISVNYKIKSYREIDKIDETLILLNQIKEFEND